MHDHHHRLHHQHHPTMYYHPPDDGATATLSAPPSYYNDTVRNVANKRGANSLNTNSNNTIRNNNDNTSNDKSNNDININNTVSKINFVSRTHQRAVKSSSQTTSKVPPPQVNSLKKRHRSTSLNHIQQLKDTKKKNGKLLSSDNISLSSNSKPPPIPNHKLRISVSSSELPTPSSSSPSASSVKKEDIVESKNSQHKLKSDKWILQHHDIWSRLTLSSFYKAMEERRLSPSQYARWLVDRTSVSISILEAATRTNELIKMHDKSIKELPILKIAKENADFLAQYTVLNGFDIHSDYRLSHSAGRLVKFIESSTAPNASVVVAITSVWSYMLSSYQAWALCIRRNQGIPPHFAPVANHLARHDAISAICDTQQVLDGLLNNGFSSDTEKAAKTFEEVVSRACDILDHTLYMADGNHVPLCTCGRKGHIPSQCTFKSHI